MNAFRSLLGRGPRLPSAKRPPRVRPLPVSIGWIVVGVLIVGLAVLFYRTSAKLLGYPIDISVHVDHPLFRESAGPLLGAEFLDGNRVQPLVNGREIFPAMLEAIRRAEKSITLESYIWASGTVSDQFSKALIERARAGVKVHALVDGMGNFKLKLSDVNRMKEAGVDFVVYGRKRWYKIKPNINHRSHRKLLVVDGKIGFTGGVCIDDQWLGDADDKRLWRETQARVEGPVVRQMQAVFAANWLQTTSRLLVGPDYFPSPAVTGFAVANCILSGPGQNAENVRMAYLLAIAAARRSIKLAHAYFVPDDLAIEMLLAARERGVEVQVVVPLNNDSRIGAAVARSRWGKLLAAGIEIHQYEPSLYHCKMMIVDDVFVSLGSTNFDNRSFSINDEVNINVIDRAVAAAFLRTFVDDLEQSRPLTFEEFRNRPFYIKAADHLAGMMRSQF